MEILTLFNLARWARAAELPADHEAVLYSSRSGEPLAIVVKPKNVQFAVKADFGMPMRALTPLEFEGLVFGMGKVHLSEFLPTDVSVFVSPRNLKAVAI